MADHARNLELKVQCPPAALDAIRARVESLVCAPIQRLHQVDTYFTVERGRLKLREIRGERDPSRTERAELIAYARPSDDGSRWSSYQVVPIAAHAAPNLLGGLLMTHDQLARVNKVRHVAVVGHTRVHLDRVDGLGTFVELETVISTQSESEAAEEHRCVIDLLGLAGYPSVAGSYSDLALAAHEGP
ncbi:MAG: class IV adenylate cyclase [Chloroflexota bacterium]|nr:class IV adenylate cyclase [Chloroflexota bacterium]